MDTSIRDNKLLKDLTKEEFDLLRDVIKIEEFHNNDAIIVIRERNRDILTILKGKVSVWDIINDKKIEMAQLEEGTIIGDMNFIIPTTRTANVSAINDVSIIRFPYKDMIAILAEYPSIANKFFAAINKGLCIKTNQTIDNYKKKILQQRSKLFS